MVRTTENFQYHEEEDLKMKKIDLMLMKIECKGFEEHFSVMNEEFLMFRQLKVVFKESRTVRKYVFDLGDKVLLPQLLHQPGQLKFTTRLKFDIKGLKRSNNGKTYVFGLTEGH